MLRWLKRAREDRAIEAAVRAGPSHIGQVEQLSDLLQSEYSTKRIRPGHA